MERNVLWQNCENVKSGKVIILAFTEALQVFTRSLRLLLSDTTNKCENKVGVRF